MDFYFYLDLGSGDQLVAPANVKTKLALIRPINDVIQRKELSGSFTLCGTDYTAAKTHFLTNGFEEAVIKIYQNGIAGVGVLKYEGWARVKGLWDEKRSLVIFDEFRTNDQYVDILPIINSSHKGEDLQNFNVYTSFGSEGQATNAEKLYNITFSTPTFTVVGSSTIVANLGRCSATLETGEVVVYDNYNATLKGYSISSGEWVETRSLALSSASREGSVTGIGSSTVALLTSNGLYQEWQFSGATFTAVPASDVFATASMKFPSTAMTNGGVNYVALVSEDSNMLRIVGSSGKSISIGEVIKPNICELDTDTIALIDARQQKLVAYSFAGSSWAQVGDALQLTGLSAPVISKYTTNQVILHDAISGRLEKYDFSTPTWSQDGNTLALSGGYISAVAVSSGNIFVAMADTFVMHGSIMHDMYSVINNVLFAESQWGTPAPLYELQTSGNGSTIDVGNIILGDMTDVADNDFEDGNTNTYQYKLSDAFKWMELWQNYWYIDSSRKIKFTQPALFSSFGTDINITSLNLEDQLNQRTYKDEFSISKEELIFNNANSSDFINNKIDYGRNTVIEESTKFPFTTDFDYLVNIYTGIIFKDIEQTGLIMYYNSAASGTPLANSGTGIISLSDTRNYLSAQSQLYNDYYKDYRYKNQGNITINGASSAILNTCRDIIEYPEVKASQTDLGITEFPDSVANLVWAVGTESYITVYEMELDTNIIIIKSRLLDL